jgi:hypothetical protein
LDEETEMNDWLCVFLGFIAFVIAVGLLVAVVAAIFLWSTIAGFIAIFLLFAAMVASAVTI